MKKIIRLTESELVSLIKRVISEEEGCTKLPTSILSKMKTEVPNTVVQNLKTKLVKGITDIQGDSGGLKKTIIGYVMGDTKELESKLKLYSNSLLDAKFGLGPQVDFNAALYDIAWAVMSKAMSVHDENFIIKSYLDLQIDSKNQQTQIQNALSSWDKILGEFYNMVNGYFNSQINMESGRWLMNSKMNPSQYCRFDPWTNKTSEESFISAMEWSKGKLTDIIKSHV